MNIQQKLTKELINYIFSNLGIVAPPLWGKAGVTENVFKTDKTVKIQFDDNDFVSYPTYSAECKINNDTLKILTTNIVDEDYNEFVLVLQMNDFQIYGLKQTVESEEPGVFLMQPKDGAWMTPSIHEKLLFCAGIEKITDSGIGWIKNNNTDLLSYLREIIES